MAEENVTQTSALQGIEYQGGEFAALLSKEFKPKSDDAKSAVEQAVLTLAQQALVNTTLIGSDVMISIEAMRGFSVRTSAGGAAGRMRGSMVRRCIDVFLRYLHRKVEGSGENRSI